MMNPASILRDSAIALAILTLGGALWGGSLGILAGGLLALGNFFLISRLVQRLVAGEAGGGAMAAGLLFKTAASLGGLWLALRFLYPPAVLVGLGTVIAAIASRAILSLFAAPVGASRA